jgi:hypothetical protein
MRAGDTECIPAYAVVGNATQILATRTEPISKGVATKARQSVRMPEPEPLIFHERRATTDELGAKSLGPLILEKGT